MQSDALRELRERVQTAKDDNRLLFYEVGYALLPEFTWSMNTYWKHLSTKSALDAALSLMRKRFPEWSNHGFVAWPGRDEGRLISGAVCRLHHDLSSGGGPRVDGYGATMALAVLDALLTILIDEKDDEKSDGRSWDRRNFEDGYRQT